MKLFAGKVRDVVKRIECAAYGHKYEKIMGDLQWSLLRCFRCEKSSLLVYEFVDEQYCVDTYKIHEDLWHD